MSKVVKAVVGVALVAGGVVTGNFQLIIAGVSVVGGALKSPKGRARDASSTTLQIGEVPRQAIFGRACTAGSLVDAFNYGGKYGTDWEVLVIAIADHQCDALEGSYIDDQYIAFAGDGAVAGFNGQLMLWWRAGTAAQTPPAILTDHGPGWTTADRGAGIAYVVVAYKADDQDAANPMWPRGRPRCRWVVRGALCYDARLDSSVGGTGAQRWADPATRAWSENVIVCRYTWSRGLYASNRVSEPAQLLIGRGLSAVEQPPANVFARANLCDEMVDGEQRYRISALVDSTDAALEVEQDFAAACAGMLAQPEGCVEIDPGAARAAVVTITDDDLIVGSRVRWSEFLGIADSAWVNSVVASFTDPAQAWVERAAPVRRDVADIVADGAPRESRLPLGMVSSVNQAGRIAEIARRLGRLWGRADIVLPPRYCFIEEGDWIIWQSQRHFGGGSRTFQVEVWSSGANWHHALTIRQISATVFTDTAPLTDGAVAVHQPERAPIGAPSGGSWALAAGHLAGSGVATPALIVTGASDDGAARFIQLEYAQVPPGLGPTTVWNDAGVAGPDVQRREISVAAGGIYYVALSYVVDGSRGARLILGPVMTGAATYPDGTPIEAVQPAEAGAQVNVPATNYDVVAPTDLSEGTLWIRPTDNRSFRFVGRELLCGGTAVTSGGAPVLVSGLIDVQDAAVPAAQAAADAAQVDADAAAAAAVAAQADVDALSARVDDIDDDAILSVAEKVEVLIPAAASFEALWTATGALAATAGVSSATAAAARATWLAYLASITPDWNNIASASPITRGALDTARGDYDAALKELGRAATEAMTAARTPDLIANFGWDIAGDVAGSVVTPLPADRRFKAMLGANDVSSATNFVLSSISAGLALTVNNIAASADRGVVTMGAGTTGGGTAVLTATLPGGAVVQRVIAVSKTDAIPATGGGTGSTFAQDTTFSSINSGAHVVISDELVVRSDASGNVRVAINLAYQSSGGTASRTPAFKAAYASAPGGSLTDMFAEGGGSACIGGTEPEDGAYVRAEATIAMPAGSTDYYFKLLGRRASGTGIIAFIGTSFTVRQ